MRSSVLPTAFSDLPRRGTRTRAVTARRQVSLPIVVGLLGTADGVALLVTGLATMKMMGAHQAVEWNFGVVVTLLGTVLALNVLHFVGAYRIETVTARGAGTGAAMGSWMFTAAMLGGLAALVRLPFGGVAVWLGVWVCAALGALTAERQGLALLLGRWRKARRLCRRVAIVGAGPLGERVLRHLECQDDSCAEVVGFYDDWRAGATQRCDGRPIAGSVNDLVEDIKRGGIDEVVIALPSADERRVAMAIHKLSAVPIALRQCVENLSFATQPCRLSQLGGLNLIGLADTPLRDWWGVCKAIEDRVLAAVALALLSPIMLLIAFLIKWDSPGPVLFRQMRHGLNDRLIEVLKFRTMYQYECDPNAECLTQRDDPRVTRLGAFLRRTMLDELPQLVNVLRGDMSIVGPRPHALSAKAGGVLYRDAVPNYGARHRMKPGMTGWAQVNGWRGTTDTIGQIEKRVECDLYYVENWSVSFDVAIILRTLLLPLNGLRRM